MSPRHPYLFSCSEDKTAMCWDLEYNKVIRHYYGHLSGVYCLSIHPNLDIMVIFKDYIIKCCKYL